VKAIYGYLGRARTCNRRIERDWLEVARQLLERGARVVVTGGRKAVLDQAVHALADSRRITGISADVTTPEGRQRWLVGALAALGGARHSCEQRRRRACRTARGGQRGFDHANGRDPGAVDQALRPTKASMEKTSRNRSAP
jgi:NAD(P)-dependent dehydrogenase (short-subunit alcohol dehydrogenase family)